MILNYQLSAKPSFLTKLVDKQYYIMTDTNQKCYYKKLQIEYKKSKSQSNFIK